MLRKRLYKLWLKFFDYDIIGEYMDNDGHGHMRKRYQKRWRLRKKKK